jgi:hypothetical protein
LKHERHHVRFKELPREYHHALEIILNIRIIYIMIRHHKRNLRQTRIEKKRNKNKGSDKNDYDSLLFSENIIDEMYTSHKYKTMMDGTGTRFMSYHQYESSQRYIQNPYLYNGPRHQDNRWSLNHPNQVMESNVHDRTRWKSSKIKSKQYRIDIDNKYDF